MSYRNYKIIDDKSGLIVPQALMNVGAKISAAFSAELSKQFKETQALNKNIAQKGYAINNATQKRIDALDETAMKGPEKLVNSFKATQRNLIQRSGELATEIMQAEMRGKSNKEINALKEERSGIQSSIGQMNTSFIKMGVIGQTTNELNTAGNSKLGNTEIYTNDEQRMEAQAITGAPDTSALYSLDENYNPIITVSDFKGSYKRAMNIGAFNDNKYNPITSIPNMYKAAFDKTNTIVDGGNGRIGNAFLENETFITENKIVDGKKAGRGQRSTQQVTPDGQAALNVALDEIMTNIGSTKGSPGQTNAVLKNQFYIPEEKIKAYQNIKDPGHQEAVDFVKFSVAKQVASQYGLESEIKIDGGDNITFSFYKKGSFKQDAAPNTYAKENNIEFSRLKKRIDRFVGTGSVTPEGFGEALTDAFNVGSGMQIKKVGTSSVVQVKDAKIVGDKLIINYKGVPAQGETASMGNVDEMILDLSNPAQLYNAVDAMTALNPSNTQALTDYIVSLKNRQ